MDVKIVAIHSNGKSELEFTVVNFEGNFEEVKEKIEEEKCFSVLQRITTKDVPTVKLGNIYDSLRILYSNMWEYEFKVEINNN